MSDYLQGKFDCIMGEPAKNGMSDEYYRGYSEQHEKTTKAGVN